MAKRRYQVTCSVICEVMFVAVSITEAGRPATLASKKPIVWYPSDAILQAELMQRLVQC